MIIDSNYKDKNKGFPESKNEILNLFFELDKFLNRTFIIKNWNISNWM